MDWNWYFSTLSQSAAGIVGIVGAFVITKILNNQALFLQKSVRTQQLLAESKLKQATAEHLGIQWYNNRSAEFQHTEFKSLITEDENMNLDDLYKELSFSVYMKPPDAKAHIEKWIKELEASRRKPNELGYSSLGGLEYHQLERDHRRNVNAEGDAIDKSYMDCRYQTEVNVNHYSGIHGNPESSNEISITIVFLSLLFLIGVIYPMSFLPASPNGYEFSWAAIPAFFFSLKGLLLVAVTILFFAIIRIFFNLNKELIYSEGEVALLKKYTAIGTFSPAFVVRELNEFN